MSKTHVAAHRFKKHEWLHLESKQELVQLVKDYERDFAPVTWNDKTIRHFFELYFHIVRGTQQHDINKRCLITILSELGRTVYGE